MTSRLFNQERSIFARSKRSAPSKASSFSVLTIDDNTSRTDFDVSSSSCPSSPCTSTTTRLPITVAASLPQIYTETSLVPVNLTFNSVREEPYAVDLRRAHRMMMHAEVNRPSASICFVIKRPGCVLCHEQGVALKGLIREFPHQSIAPWAVIKETGVDDKGLMALYQNHFPFQFYRDTELRLYKALGDRKVTLTDALTKIIPAKRRVVQKGMKSKIIGKGEGVILGGVLVFDKHGKIKYAHQEQFGLELPVDEIRKALQQVIDDDANENDLSVPSFH